MSELDDPTLAARLAQAAGHLLLTLQRDGLLSARALGRVGDRAANALLVEALREHRPADGLLSEEEKADPARLAERRVWIVDPLDGTREFGELRTDWAVHVALSVDGVATVGAVALPGLGVTLNSADVILAEAAQRAPVLVVSRTRPAAEAQRLADELKGRLLPMGSAGAKAMAVVRGEADIYVHSGGQFEWDSCAPVAVAAAAGLHVSRLDGSPLRYNQPDPYLPDLVICRPEYAELVLGRLAEY